MYAFSVEKETECSNHQPSVNLAYKDFSSKTIPILPTENLFKHMTQEQFEKRVTNSIKWKEKVEVFQDLIQVSFSFFFDQKLYRLHRQICEKLRRVKPCDCGIMISVLLKTIQLDSNLAVVS
jgi:hypothetical protein